MPDESLKIAAFGATGRTGKRLVAAALAAGHTVRALVRDPSRIEARPGLEVVVGDVLDFDAVKRTVDGCDAAVATLGGGTTAAPGQARSEGMLNIAGAMGWSPHCHRIVALGGAGTLDIGDGSGRLRSERPNYPEVFRVVSAEHRAAWVALQNSGLEWTLVCPPDIPDGEPTGNYRVTADVFPENGKALTTGDLAAFMLKELIERKFVQRRVGIAT
jgi:putative NADH-flavin reductase